MLWLLLLAGTVLVVAGAWWGSGPHTVPRRAEPDGPADLSAPEAWAILTRPVKMAVEERRQRRFVPGLLVGIGSGLVVMALVMLALPTPTRVRPPLQADGKVAPPEGVVRTPAPDPKPLTLTFVVEDGEAAPTIAAKLHGAGLITDEEAFLRRVVDRRVDTRLKAGTFIISTGATLDEVIDSLTA